MNSACPLAATAFLTTVLKINTDFILHSYYVAKAEVGYPRSPSGKGHTLLSAVV